MRIQHLVTLGSIALLAVLAISCSKMTADVEADVRKSFGIPADMPMKDLGAVEFRAGIPKRVRLGAGKDCTITVTVLTNGFARMNLLYESKGAVIDGVMTQAHSERSELVFRPAMVPAGWRLCAGPFGERLGEPLVLAIQPVITP